MRKSTEESRPDNGIVRTSSRDVQTSPDSDSAPEPKVEDPGAEEESGYGYGV